jgi:hypothetical protein
VFYTPVLVAHICAGSLGLVSGSAAMCFRKGSPRHVLAGKLFVGSMLAMAGAAMYLATVKHQSANVVGGLLTFYMVTTGWLTARRGDGVTGKFDWGVLVIPVALGSWLWVIGLERVFSRTPTNDGVPAFMAFFIGSVALLSAAGDVRVLVRGGVSGTKRLLRHLWRMSFGLFIASGSFFLGPSNRPLRMLQGIGLGRFVSPTYFNNWLYMFLTVLPFILMIFWLVRVRFSNAFKARAITNAPVSAD